MECPYCKGRGSLDAGEGCMLSYPCEDCEGTGYVEHCGECDGYYAGDFCENCYGRCEGCGDVYLLAELNSENLCECCQEVCNDERN